MIVIRDGIQPGYSKEAAFLYAQGLEQNEEQAAQD
jgi:hypothetical protein